MKVGIALDSWKLPVFKGRLDKAGFEYTERTLTAETIMLGVQTNDLTKLKSVIEQCQAECLTIRDESLNQGRKM